ncbi:ATP-binding protein [Stieleria varia]|uniref:histidine kinase n=1 Tax=Stieleria varia TaxID=2528005 RepID=A0A5C6B016_9BACT|nr:ATP-binding protein [Stieleria varia]TWU05563.1 Sensor protein EvgS precursor [Stieleria varia]
MFKIGVRNSASSQPIFYDGLVDRSGIPVAWSEARTAEDSSGNRLLSDRYRIIRELQDVPSVNCWLTLDETTNTRCVVRDLPQNLFFQGLKARLENEAGLLAEVDCASYCAMQQFELRDQKLRLVYPWIEGQSLQRIVDRQPPTAHQAMSWICDLLTALCKIHELGVVHRDVRPSHVVIRQGGSAVLAGYGPVWRAALMSGDSHRGREIASFASPELAGIIKQDIGPTSDLYSIGLLLYHMLTQRMPFSGDTVSEILFQQSTIGLSVANVPVQAPPYLISFLEHLTRKEPRERYQSAESALRDAESIRDAIERGDLECPLALGHRDSRSVIIDPAFISRESDVDTIHSCLGDALSGGWQRIAISGVPGIGKSRLIEESVQRATRMGFQVLIGEASGSEVEEPAGIWLRMVNQLADLLSSERELRRRVAQVMADHRDELLTAMPRLANALDWTESSDKPRSRSATVACDHELEGPYELGQCRIVTAFATLMTHLGAIDHPVLMVLDDCELLDEMSRRILSQVLNADATHQTLIFGFRDDVESAQPYLAMLDSCTHLALKPMNDEGISQLCESMAGHLPASAIKVVRDYAKGNPFMAATVLRGMIDSEVLHPEKDCWSIDSEKLREFQVAESAGDVFEGQFSQLPASSRDFLVAAAVVGNQFSMESVVALTEMDSFETHRHLAIAREHRLIWSKPDGGFAFVQDNVRQTILHSVTEDHLRELHRRFARHLQATQPTKCFELAHHFDAAGMHREALPHAVNAAIHARQRYSLDGATRYLQIAIRAFPHAQSVTRHFVEMMMSEVLLLQGEFDQAERWLDWSAASAISESDKAAVAMRRGELSFKRGKKGQAIAYFETALRQLGQPVSNSRTALLKNLICEISIQMIHTFLPSRISRREREPDPTEKLCLHLYSKLAHTYWYTRDRFHTLWAHLRGLNQAERFTESTELAQAYSEHAPVMNLMGMHQRGLRYAQLALDMRHDRNDVWGQGQTLNFLSMLLYSSSQFEKCIEQSRQSVEILTRTGDRWDIYVARYQLAAACLRQGRLRDALDEARAAYRFAIQNGDDHATGKLIDIWAQASLGKLPADVLNTELSRDVYDPQRLCQIKLAEGVNAFYQNDMDHAVDALRDSVAIAQRASLVNAYTAPASIWLVTAMRRRYELSTPISLRKRNRSLREIEAAAKRALKIARRFTNDLPHALRECAAVAGMRGQFHKSKRCFRESLNVATQQDADWEHAQTVLMFQQYAQELGWTVDQRVLRHAEQTNNRVRLSVGCDDDDGSLSLVDRFDSLLDAGRQIATSLSPDDIRNQVLLAATKIFRGDRVLIVEQSVDGGRSVTTPIDAPFDAAIVSRAERTGGTVITDRENVSSNESHSQASTARTDSYGAFLCTPIRAHGDIIAYLYVANSHMAGMYGDDEIRIANYLASAAGGAMEKADGFAQLERLNQTLEVKVQDRTAALVRHSKELQETADRLQAAQQDLNAAKEAAEAANDAKSEFLARMSHEIRTPITAVLGYTELMLRGIDSDPDKRRHDLQTIHANGTHLLHIVNDILDLSKIEAKCIDVEQLPCSPAKIVGEVVESMSAKASEKQIELRLAFDSNIPETISSDPTRLRQILINLIGNAIKFTHRGSVLVSVSGSSTTIKVVIQDTGIGMTPSQMERVFDPFTQADTSTTRRYGGTGLGLSISKQLATSLGGDLTVSSQMGVGSSFTLTVATNTNKSVRMLSKDSAAEVAGGESDAAWVRVDLTGIHVLVVDDAPTNRDLITRLLSVAGAKVQSTEDGQQAIEVLKERDSRIDVILMDMQMPVLDGYTATRCLRDSGLNTPIIAMTANTMLGDDAKCKAAGCSDYLSKPLDLDLLTRRVRDWAKGRHCIPINPVPHESTDESSLADETLPSNWLRKYAVDFASKVLAELPQLQQMCRTGDFSAVAKRAHWMKGSGGTVGLKNITVLAKACEESAKRSSETDTLDALDRIDQYIDKLLNEHTVNMHCG